jgi:hypothetical protein
MRGLAALVLAGVLVAPASFAQILGDQSGILGGDAGFLRSSGPAVRIDAMPFARTVTCSDYTLTGTAPGAGAVSWAASPSGASGACTGTTSWSCVVDVAPDAVGEGVETITVSQSGATGGTVTIGFYFEGEHSCFLAQSYDGAYNSGKADLAAVATWVNLGSSALNVTQATGSAQPTHRTGIVNGQPMVRFDGTDRLTAALPADWIFLHDGTGATIDSISMTSVSQTGAIATTSSTGFTTGIRHRVNGSFTAQYSLLNGVAAGSVSSAASALTSGAFDALTSTASAADTPDLTLYINNVSVGTPVDAPSFPAGNPTTALSIGATGAGVNPLTGDLFRVMAYVSSLSATQRAINKAVDEWALGGTLPVTP